jgi:hypothetical protein
MIFISAHYQLTPALPNYHRRRQSGPIAQPLSRARGLTHLAHQAVTRPRSHPAFSLACGPAWQPEACALASHWSVVPSRQQLPQQPRRLWRLVRPKTRGFIAQLHARPCAHIGRIVAPLLSPLLFLFAFWHPWIASALPCCPGGFQRGKKLVPWERASPTGTRGGVVVLRLVTRNSFAVESWCGNDLGAPNSSTSLRVRDIPWTGFPRLRSTMSTFHSNSSSLPPSVATFGSEFRCDIGGLGAPAMAPPWKPGCRRLGLVGEQERGGNHGDYWSGGQRLRLEAVYRLGRTCPGCWIVDVWARSNRAHNRSQPLINNLIRYRFSKVKISSGPLVSNPTAETHPYPFGRVNY